MHHRSQHFCHLVLAIWLCAISVSCHDRSRGRRISSDESYSQSYLLQLLGSRVNAEVQISNRRRFSLHRASDRDPSSDGFGIEVFWLEFPPGTAKLGVSQISSHGDLGDGFAGVSGKDDLVILNGGYWDTQTETKRTKDGKEASEVIQFPLGLVVANRRTIAPLARNMAGGIVYQAGQKLAITPTERFEELGITPEQAIQCKPLLVHDAHSAMKSDDHKRDDRLAIGINRSGGVVVAIALGPRGAFTLFEFAEFLLISASNGGPECQVALNLDGGPGARLYVPALNLSVGKNGSGYLNNVIRLY